MRLCIGLQLSQCLHLRMHHAVQRAVLQQIGTGLVEDDFELAVRHQCGATRHVLNALIEFGGFVVACCPHQIQHFGARLHDIGRQTTAIGDGVVHAGVRGHVLAQIVHPHVHELHCIQGAAAQVGRVRGMRCLAMEDKLCLNIGQRALAEQTGVAGWVPGQCCIHIIEHAGAGHEGLAGAAFLGWTAVIAHASARAGAFQVLLQRNSGKVRRSSQ